MGLFVVGLNHQSAPVALREQFAVAPGALSQHLGHVRGQDPGIEAMLLSTCNRVELYGVRRELPTIDQARHYFGNTGTLSSEHLYLHTDAAAVRHLFRVASSLESMIVGEPEILGQLKHAFSVAKDVGSAGPVLNRVVSRAFSVAKRVRNDTEIGRASVSVARSGVELAKQVFGDLSGCRVLLLGAGEVAAGIGRALLAEGVADLVVSNRTFERGAELASTFNGSAIPFSAVPSALERVDIVLSSVAGTDPVLSADNVAAALRRRRYRPLFLIDLGVPRNIDPAVHDVEGAFLFDIDDLSNLANQGKERRLSAADLADSIVDEEVTRFVERTGDLDAEHLIATWSRNSEQLRRQEIERSQGFVEGLDLEQREQLERLTKSLVRKLLHRPFRALRTVDPALGNDPWGELRKMLTDDET